MTSFMPPLMVNKIDQYIACGKQTAESSKASVQRILIKDPKVKELKAEN